MLLENSTSIDPDIPGNNLSISSTPASHLSMLNAKSCNNAGITLQSNKEVQMAGPSMSDNRYRYTNIYIMGLSIASILYIQPAVGQCQRGYKLSI